VSGVRQRGLFGSGIRDSGESDDDQGADVCNRTPPRRRLSTSPPRKKTITGTVITTT